MDTLKLGTGSNFAHFFAITRLASQPGDFLEHTLRIQVTGKSGDLISQADDYQFQYGYRIVASDPGGFVLTTEFNIDVRPLALPIGCLVNAFLDGQSVARTPLMLRRG